LPHTFTRHSLLVWFIHWEGRREEQHAAGHAAAADSFGKREGHLLSLTLLAFILPIK